MMATATAKARSSLPSSTGTGTFACVAAVFEADTHIGMASVLLTTLEQLRWCEALPGAVPTVFWSGCAACADDSAAGEVVDSWPQWFEPVNAAQVRALDGGGAGGAGGAGRASQPPLCPAQNKLGFPLPAQRRGLWPETDGDYLPLLSAAYGNHSEATSYFAAGMTPQRRQLAHRLLSQYCKLAPPLQKQVDAFAAKHFAGRAAVIAVHVRATDHVYEFKQDNMVFMAAYFERVDALLAQLATQQAAAVAVGSSSSPEKKVVCIFVAADNDEAVRQVEKRYGARRGIDVVHTAAPRSQSMGSIDWVMPSAAEGRRATGDGIFLDAWLLSKASHLVHWDSAVSKLAAFLNPDLQSHYIPGPDELGAGGVQLTAADITAQTQRRSAKEQQALERASAARPCGAHEDCASAGGGADGKVEFCAWVQASVRRPVELRCVPCAEWADSQGGGEIFAGVTMPAVFAGGHIPERCQFELLPGVEAFRGESVRSWDASLTGWIHVDRDMARLAKKLVAQQIEWAKAAGRERHAFVSFPFVPGVSGGAKDDLVADTLSLHTNGALPLFWAPRYSPAFCPSNQQTNCVHPQGMASVRCNIPAGRGGSLTQNQLPHIVCSTVCRLPHLVKFAAAYKILADTVGLVGETEEITEMTPEKLIQKLVTKFCQCGVPPAAPGETNFRHIAQNIMTLAHNKMLQTGREMKV
jgi:hypothetical protein